MIVHCALICENTSLKSTSAKLISGEMEKMSLHEQRFQICIFHHKSFVNLLRSTVWVWPHYVFRKFVWKWVLLSAMKKHFENMVPLRLIAKLCPNTMSSHWYISIYQWMVKNVRQLPYFKHFVAFHRAYVFVKC